MEPQYIEGYLEGRWTVNGVKRGPDLTQHVGQEDYPFFAQHSLNLPGIQKYYAPANGGKIVFYLIVIKGCLLSLVLDSDYSMVIRFFTPFTPFTSLASLVAKVTSAALLALPYNVTSPLFVSTLVLMALVDR